MGRKGRERKGKREKKKELLLLKKEMKSNAVCYIKIQLNFKINL